MFGLDVHPFQCVHGAHKKSEENIGSPGTGVTDACELPCGFWELNLGPGTATFTGNGKSHEANTAV